MKVPHVFGPDDLRLVEVEVPHAGPRDVVLQVASAGICGSDLGFVAQGGLLGPTQQPLAIGHELAGTVIEVGAEVDTVKLGDRVILNPLVNLIGNGAAEGGFAERLLVRDVANRPESLLALPDELTMDEGALVEPLAVAMHAINRAAVTADSKVAIFGAGPIGLAATVVLKHRGVKDVVVFDLSAFRRERAITLGASAAFDPREKALRDALIDVHGSVTVFRADMPATTHFLEASGAPILPEIVAIARSNATICVASLQKKPVSLDFATVMARELKLVGTLGYPHELPEVLEMLSNRRIDLSAMISHRIPSSDFLEAFAIASRPDEAAKVIVRYGTD